MGLLDDVVALAYNVTDSLGLQAVITYEKYLSTDGAGKKAYVAPTSIKALVENKQRQIRGADGQLGMSRAKVTILDPSIVVSVFDRITLPDGTTGPILDISGFINSVHPILSEVYIG